MTWKKQVKLSNPDQRFSITKQNHRFLGLVFDFDTLILGSNLQELMFDSANKHIAVKIKWA